MLRRLTLALALAPLLAQALMPLSLPSRPILMVVRSGPVRPGDDALRRQLEGRGFGLVMKDGPSVRPADLNGKLLVLISSSVSESELGALFREMAVPMVVLAPLLYDDLGLASGRLGEDYGYDTTLGRPDKEVTHPGHPLTGGLSAPIGVSGRPADFGWARPTSDAIVAVQAGDASPRATVFGYEAGTAMADLDAPARRVGLFVTEGMAPFLTREGWTLFDAAIDWAAGLTPSVAPAPEAAASSPVEPAPTSAGPAAPAAVAAEPRCSWWTTSPWAAGTAASRLGWKPWASLSPPRLAPVRRPRTPTA